MKSRIGEVQELIEMGMVECGTATEDRRLLGRITADVP